MLVINRKVGETIVIGDNVLVTVLESSNGSIRLGIDAPTSVSVLRRELVQDGIVSKLPKIADPT
jgi:carbon storage regulator